MKSQLGLKVAAGKVDAVESCDDLFASERRAPDPLQRVRWHDGVYCPRCRTESDWVRQISSVPAVAVSPHRGVSKDELTFYLRALRLRQSVCRKPGEKSSESFLKPRYELINNLGHKSDTVFLRVPRKRPMEIGVVKRE